MLTLHTLVLLAEGEAPGGAPGLLQTPWIPIAMVGLLFYFMLIRPEQRKRAQHATMLSSLKKNDRVITAGGIYGTVVNVLKDGADVTIKVDENSNTRLRIQRGSISRVISDDEQVESPSST